MVIRWVVKHTEEIIYVFLIYEFRRKGEFGNSH